MSETTETNEDLQLAIIGSMLLEPLACRNVRESVKRYNMKSEYMTVPELRALYDVLIDDPSEDPTILWNVACRKASGALCAKAIDHASPISTDIDRAVRMVKDAGLAQKATQIPMQVMSELGGGRASGEYMVQEMKRRVDGLFAEVYRQAQSDDGFSLRDLGEPIPEDEDPDCLFKGRFLEKGGALVLVSVSGSGKSLISLQLAFSWAVGKSIFGITPMRPLKIGIFQTEDSRQVLAEFNKNITDGYRRQGWKVTEVDKALDNIRLYNVGGRMDNEFLEYLSAKQMQEKFDLVIINPLNGITCIDISDNTKMNELLCKGLDPIIKHNEDTKCGLMIVHHTNKPPAANQRIKASQDRYAQYLGAGAARLTNWMRAMLVIMPTADRGQYEFIAAKRGERLDWPDPPGKPPANPTRLLRHATREEGIMFWYEVDMSGLAGAVAGAQTGGESEEPCVTKDAALLAGELQKEARPLSKARDLAYEMFKRKRGNAAYDEMLKNLSDYHVAIRPTGKANKNIIGSEESLQNWFSGALKQEADAAAAKLAENTAQKPAS